MFKIEPATEKQVYELKKLKRLCEIESGWSPPQEYLDEWTRTVLGVHNQDSYLLKVALMDKKIVGYCISVRKLHNYNGVVMDVTWKSAYIRDIFVLEEYRNMGIGKALINDAVAYLKSIGVNKIVLIVNYWNENVKKLFGKLGFKLWGYLPLKSES